MQHGRLAGPVSAMSEIHMHYEHPFRFVYHTLRWLSVRPATTLHAAVNCGMAGLLIDEPRSSEARRSTTIQLQQKAALYTKEPQMELDVVRVVSVPATTVHAVCLRKACLLIDEGSALYKPVRVVPVAKAFLLWFRTRRTKKTSGWR